MMQPGSILEEASLKSTSARLAILRFLDEALTPPTADEIFVHLQEEHKKGTDRVTVYRILDTFYKKDLVRRLEFSEGKYRYELAGEDHHHLICEACGKIEDISDCSIDSWEEEIQQNKRFTIKRHALEFYGVCKQCQH